MEAFAALFEAFASMISVIGQLVGLIVEIIVFSISRLFDKPKEGEPPLGAKHFFLALAPLIVIMLMVAGSWWYFVHLPAARRQLVEATTSAVTDAADDVVKAREAGEPDPDAVGKDAWNQPLMVRSLEGAVHETIVVSSIGPDGIADTEDDIEARKSRLLGKKELGKKALGAIKERVLSD